MIPLPSVGEPVEIYWPLDRKYYPGKVHEVTDGMYNIKYDDGETETQHMAKDNCRYPAISSNTIQAPLEMQSSEPNVLKQYLDVLGYKDFMLHQAQGLPDFPMHNTYSTQEEKFKSTVKEVYSKSIPESANVITSHVLYKIKANDDVALRMKARIAPHGNEDRERDKLKSDSATCPPTGIRMLLSIASLLKWPLAKIDFTSAFLQT